MQLYSLIFFQSKINTIYNNLTTSPAPSTTTPAPPPQLTHFPYPHQHLRQPSTHTLPTQDPDLRWIARTMGFADTGAFLAEMDSHRELVAQEFDALLGSPQRECKGCKGKEPGLDHLDFEVLLASTQGYIFIWLSGYGALLGPIAGIMIADYWVVRRTELTVSALYAADGEYRYVRGWNPAALIAFAAPVLINLPGFLHTALPSLFGGIAGLWVSLYDYAWFIGVGLAFGLYAALMRGRRPR